MPVDTLQALRFLSFQLGCQGQNEFLATEHQELRKAALNCSSQSAPMRGREQTRTTCPETQEIREKRKKMKENERNMRRVLRRVLSSTLSPGRNCRKGHVNLEASRVKKGPKRLREPLPLSQAQVSCVHPLR